MKRTLAQVIKILILLTVMLLVPLTVERFQASYTIGSKPEITEIAATTESTQQSTSSVIEKTTLKNYIGYILLALAVLSVASFFYYKLTKPKHGKK